MGAFVIKGGEIYDPAAQKWEKKDIAIENGMIISGMPSGEYQVVDASGCKVTTGWIDYHVHYFNHGTENGINPDAASFPCGVTTAVDGGSTGAANYEMYRKSAMAYSDVRILNMLLVGSGGQVTDRYPEHLEKKYFDIPKIKKLFREYPDNLVGLKSRMSVGIIAPEDAEESIRATVELAGELGCNVSVHVTNPVMDLEKLAGILRKDDMICHIYQGKGKETCYVFVFDEDGNVCKEGSGLYSNPNTTTDDNGKVTGNIVFTARSKNNAQIAGIANITTGNVNSTYEQIGRASCRERV